MPVQIRIQHTFEQSLSIDFIVRVQALSRAYLVRKNSITKEPSRCSSELSSPPSLRALSRQARYARAEAALRSSLLKSESEPNPLELQIRVMQKGLSAWNSHVVLGQQRVQNAENAMAALQTGDQSPAFLARVSLGELQKEKWMGIKERDEALEMVKKIKKLIDELKKELQSGSKRSSLIPTPTHPTSVEIDEPPSSKVKILFSGRFPYPYLARLPRSRHSVEPLRLPLKDETRRRASSLSSSSKPIPNSPLSASSSSSSAASSIDEDRFGAVLIYRSDLRTPNKHEQQDHFKLPSYVDTLLGELSEDRIGSPELDLSDDTWQAMSVPATPTSQKMPPSSYQTSVTPKPKARVMLRHRLSNLSISTFKNNNEPPALRSSTDTFVHPPETTPTSPSTPPITPRRKHRRIESVIDSVKKSVKRMSSRLVEP